MARKPKQVVSIRLDGSLWQIYSSLAERSGMKVSEWVRQAMKEKSDRQIEEETADTILSSMSRGLGS